MTHARHIAAGILAVPALAGCDANSNSAGSSPSTPGGSDLTFLEGARAGQAELTVTSQGYEMVRSDGRTNYWLNRSTGSCAKITTSDGRYSSIFMLSADNC